MTKEEIIQMAREAADQSPREDWNTTAWVFGEDALQRFAALVAIAERERIKQANAPEIEKINEHFKMLESDPAIHFCHRFAILMESMLLTNDVNLDKYWDEAHALLDEYNSARDKWMEAHGQPYVSGFGKD